MRIFVILTVLAVAVLAIAGQQPTSPAATPKPGEKVAVIDTNHGTIVIQFLRDKAPNTVANFIKLAEEGFYDGTLFHRVIPGFMIQGGDPNTKLSDRSQHGFGGPGYTIKAELNDQKHERGIVSMARGQDIDSAGSQFFIMVAAAPHLDNRYTAFGRVIQGMEVVDKIVQLRRDERDNPLDSNPAVIRSIRIRDWPLKD
jgi:cyclophilin family peptidyl-prolyl cis-trans isomerase